jgi:hypothetical protein
VEAGLSQLRLQSDVGDGVVAKHPTTGVAHASSRTLMRRRGEPVARSAEPRCRNASTLRTATSHRTGCDMRAAAAPADMCAAHVGLANMRLANMRPAYMRRPEMHPASACPDAYSAAVPAKPTAMAAKTSEVSAPTMPTATAAMSTTAAMPPAATMAAATAATAGVCFECEKRHNDEQHRRSASADSKGCAGLAPHRRGRLSLRILPWTKNFQQ